MKFFYLKDILTKGTTASRNVLNRAEVKIPSIPNVSGVLSVSAKKTICGKLGGSWLYVKDQMGKEYQLSKVDHGNEKVFVLSRGFGEIPNLNPVWTDRKDAQKIGSPQVYLAKKQINVIDQHGDRFVAAIDKFTSIVQKMEQRLEAMQRRQETSDAQLGILMEIVTAKLGNGNKNKVNNQQLTADILRNFCSTEEGYKTVVNVLLESKNTTPTKAA